jgi:hypothetical protein
MYQILGDKLKNYKIAPIIHDSYQPDIYKYYVKEMIRENWYPKFIIIPINLRVFSPEWDLQPGFQFTDERLFLTYMHTPLAPFIPFMINFGTAGDSVKSDLVFQNAPVYYQTKKVGLAGEFRNTELLKSYETRMKRLTTLFYMAKLNPNQRKLQSLIEIADMLSATPTKVIFYITPIDYQSGSQFLGTDLENQIRENADLITKILNKKDQNIINLSLSLGADQFIWKSEGWFINEHINQSGKAAVVEHVAAMINPVLQPNIEN